MSASECQDGGAVRIHHVAVAVADIARAAKVLSCILGRPFSDARTLDEHGVRVAFAETGGCAVELIEPAGDRHPQLPVLPNPVASFLGKHGQNLHHIAVEVADLNGTLAQLDREGIRAVPLGPQRGSTGQRVAFLNPADAAGILIELIER